MDKKTFKKMVLEVIKDRNERYLEQAKKAIKRMDEKELAEFEENFFAPKAFYEALLRANNDNVTSRTYSIGYVRKYNKAMWGFLSDIYSSY